MKLFLSFILLVFAQVSFAKAKEYSVDFNNLIKQESQSQNETHKAISAGIQMPEYGSIDRSKNDQNKIIFTRAGSVQVLDVSGKKVKALNKAPKQRLGSIEKLEEDDFSRLDHELNSLQ